MASVVWEWCRAAWVEGGKGMSRWVGGIVSMVKGSGGEREDEFAVGLGEEPVGKPLRVLDDGVVIGGAGGLGQLSLDGSCATAGLGSSVREAAENGGGHGERLR